MERRRPCNRNLRCPSSSRRQIARRIFQQLPTSYFVGEKRGHGDVSVNEEIRSLLLPVDWRGDCVRTCKRKKKYMSQVWQAVRSSAISFLCSATGAARTINVPADSGIARRRCKDNERFTGGLHIFNLRNRRLIQRYFLILFYSFLREGNIDLSTLLKNK